MGKYTRREFQIGDYYLSQRDGSPAWYRTRYEPKARRTERVSLGTESFEEAKERLTDWYIANRVPVQERPQEAFIADVLRRYYTEHGSKIRSAVQANVAVNHWLDFWGTDSVAALRDIRRQEEFQAKLLARGMKASAVNRVLVVGKAALNRAYKRGELEAAPYVALMPLGQAAEPRGEPMSVAQLAALYGNAAPHLQIFIRWMLGTAARPEAIRTLHRDQVAEGLIYLNPRGRTQNKKYRATVKLIPSLAGDVWEGWLITYEGERVKSLRTAWEAARERAKLGDEFKPYSLRHTAARWMRRRGVPGEEVSQQLGHKPDEHSTTRIYTADDPAYLKKAAKALDGLVSAMVKAA